LYPPIVHVIVEPFAAGILIDEAAVKSNSVAFVLNALAPEVPECVNVRALDPLVPLPITFWTVQESAADAEPFQYVPLIFRIGDDCDVPEVAAVVFAHVQFTAEVWLNVVVFPAMENVTLPLGFPILFHSTVLKGMVVCVLAMPIAMVCSYVNSVTLTCPEVDAVIALTAPVQMSDTHTPPVPSCAVEHGDRAT
jgi:hypothetical protein